MAINSETWETLNPDGTKTHFEFELTRKMRLTLLAAYCTSQNAYSPDRPSMGNRQLYNKTFSSLGRRCSVSDRKITWSSLVDAFVAGHDTC